jgi:uncharacterized protein (TIGR00251 family)
VIPLEEIENGIVLCVKAHPAARRNAITGTHDGALKVAVSQAPEKGKATLAILDVIAKSLELKKSQVELLSGQTSTHKKFLIRGISADDLAARIAMILNDLEST